MIIKIKDIKKMSKKEIEEKVKDLRIELIKNKIASGKGGKLKIKEIKRTIARLHTINRLNEISIKNKPNFIKKFKQKLKTKWIYAQNVDCLYKLVFVKI